jgi:hypothetical protein
LCAQTLRESSVAATGGRHIEKTEDRDRRPVRDVSRRKGTDEKKAKGRKETRTPEDCGQSGRIATHGRFSPLPADVLQLGRGADGRDLVEIERHE